jgi:hypothetical protein
MHCYCATYRTLRNTLRSWNETGFLGMMHEKLMILNDPLPAEVPYVCGFIEHENTFLMI